MKSDIEQTDSPVYRQESIEHLMIAGDRYKIVSVNSGQVVAVSWASRDKAAALIQYPYDGGASQQWELIRLNKERWNTRIANVPDAFDYVPESGRFSHYSGTINNPFGIGHVQGMASYSGHYIFTHNLPKSSRGRFIIVSEAEGKVSLVFDTPEPGYNHPGGCQVIGDYLAVSLETGKNDNDEIAGQPSTSK